MRHEIARVMADIGHPGFTRHGLRMNAVINLLEAGCSRDQVGAITGQSDRTVGYYAKQVSKKRLAREAIRKLTENAE